MRTACLERNNSRCSLVGHVVFLGLIGFMFWPGSVAAQAVLPTTLYPVGMTQVEFVEPSEGGRTLNFMLIYPAAPDADAPLFNVLMSTNLRLYKDAPLVADGLEHPLVMFSHGAGGNGAGYAWFGQYLASHGYVVAMLYHYRANTFDSSAVYVRNRLWQRPRDISLDITHLLLDKKWGPRIDPNQIGVAGHSQGGFTSLWIGGAQVNPKLFAAFQRAWKNNESLPAYLRAQMSVDPTPALHVHDNRVKAAFAMAPGDVQAFGMDEVRPSANDHTGLHHRRRRRYHDAAEGKRRVCC